MKNKKNIFVTIIILFFAALLIFKLTTTKKSKEIIIKTDDIKISYHNFGNKDIKLEKDTITEKNFKDLNISMPASIKNHPQFNIKGNKCYGSLIITQGNNYLSPELMLNMAGEFGKIMIKKNATELKFKAENSIGKIFYGKSTFYSKDISLPAEYIISAIVLHKGFMMMFNICVSSLDDKGDYIKFIKSFKIEQDSTTVKTTSNKNISKNNLKTKFGQNPTFFNLYNKSKAIILGVKYKNEIIFCVIEPVIGKNKTEYGIFQDFDRKYYISKNSKSIKKAQQNCIYFVDGNEVKEIRCKKLTNKLLDRFANAKIDRCNFKQVKEFFEK